MSETTSSLKAGRREWLGLGVIALPCILYSLDLTVLTVAVPHLAADLQPSSTQMLWIIDIYGFLVAAFLITMGTLGDRIGRRRLLMIGAVAFGASSMLAAFSTSAEMLIVARALLGLAGATLAPSTLSLIFNMFHEPTERTFAVGIWIASYSVGAIIGPLVGGVMLEFFWWGSVFLLAVPVMVLLLALAPVLLPEYRNPSPGRMDLISVGLSLVGLLAMVYGLKETATHGLEWGASMAVLTGLAVAAVFVRRQHRLADPLLDLHLFRIPAFSASVAAYAICFGVMFGGYVFVLQHLQLVLGYSPLGAGTWMIPSGVGFVLSGILTPALAQRFRPGSVMATGVAVAAGGFAVLALVDTTTSVWLIAGAFTVLALGVTPVFTLATDLVVGSVPRERSGMAASLSETAAEFGGAMGIAALGSIGVALYRSRLEETIPAAVPGEQAALARDTLAGANEAATELPGDLGAALLQAANEAFGAGLQASAITGAVLLALVSAAVATWVRGVRPVPAIEVHTDPEPSPTR